MSPTQPPGIVTRDMATQLAHAAQDAAEIGPPQPPSHVVLPGAKQAITHAHLLAYQTAGSDQHTIVARVNQRFEREHADTLAKHAEWVQGPYAGAIEEMRRRAAEKAAEQMRERALFEALIAERDSKGG